MEKEVMGMSVYNGKLYAGTLPLADVYRYDANSKWTSVGQLDKTPNVRYRRAWTMAVYQGKLECVGAPSKITTMTFSYQFASQSVAVDFVGG